MEEGHRSNSLVGCATTQLPFQQLASVFDLLVCKIETDDNFSMSEISMRTEMADYQQSELS